MGIADETGIVRVFSEVLCLKGVRDISMNGVVVDLTLETCSSVLQVGLELLLQIIFHRSRTKCYARICLQLRYLANCTIECTGDWGIGRDREMGWESEEGLGKAQACVGRAGNKG
jgi:hypothetical protein